MKALELSANKELAVVEREKPNIGENEVLVAIKAAALNHREIWIAQGLYPGMTLPCILGADGAGVVVEAGSQVTADWKDAEVVIYPAYGWGDNNAVPTKQFRVLGMPDPGTLAEYIVVPVENLFPKPKHLNWEEAAALPIAYLTAWRALVYHGNIDKDSKVLITGIGGGVAQAGLSIAHALGAEVYVTSSKQEKIDISKTHGANGGVNYKDQLWPKQLKDLSGGIDVVLDSSPSAVLDDYFTFLNYGAKIIAYGSTGSRKTTINISKFFLRHIQFIGTAMGSPQEFKDMLAFVSENEIKPVVHSSYVLDEVIDAIDELKAGGQVGKIVVRIE